MCCVGILAISLSSRVKMGWFKWPQKVPFEINKVIDRLHTVQARTLTQGWDLGRDPTLRSDLNRKLKRMMEPRLGPWPRAWILQKIAIIEPLKVFSIYIFHSNAQKMKERRREEKQALFLHLYSSFRLDYDALVLEFVIFLEETNYSLGVFTFIVISDH